MIIGIAVLVALAIGILACALAVQSGKLAAEAARAEQAERDRAGYQQAFESAEARAARLKQALVKNVEVEEKTHAEHQELAATPNTELVTRANHLFGGVSNKPHD
jgi:flavin-dependent dehydrogenase